MTAIHTRPAHVTAPSSSERLDGLVLCSFALLLLLIHFLMGNGYGFHRDELQFLSDARHLDWGFVAYPPMTSFCGRVAIALFGISPQVLRLPAAVLNGATLILVGLLARELGGNRLAQGIAMAAVFPTALVFSSMLQYNTPDLLAWTLLAFAVARVLRTGHGRYWLLAGAATGFGVLSKYSIAFPVASLLVALVAMSSQRHHLRSRWFWWGVLLALVIASPNLLWLARHQFLTIQMEQYIHKRDVGLGRASGYWTDQLKFTLLALPLAVVGLVTLLRSIRFRLLAAFYLGPLLLLALAKGRGYYLLPGYVVLYAASGVAVEGFLRRRGRTARRGLVGGIAAAMLVNCAAVAWAYLPIWHVGSAAWTWQMANNGDMSNEVGWPELVAQVAAVRDRLSPDDRARLGILANNYGEAAALELYGPSYGIPEPISSVNSFHLRGWGPYEPETLIVLGGELDDQLRNFQSCTVVGHVWLPNAVHTEETDDHPEILVCHHLRGRWPDVWSRSQEFG